MIKKTKTFNPLLLDTEKDEPTFVGNTHKWWLIEVSKTKRFCAYMTEQIGTGKKMYVLLDNKTQQVVRETTQLEDLFTYLEVFDRAMN